MGLPAAHASIPWARVAGQELLQALKTVARLGGRVGHRAEDTAGMEVESVACFFQPGLLSACHPYSSRPELFAVAIQQSEGGASGCRLFLDMFG